MPSRQQPSSFPNQQTTKHRATFIFLVITIFSSLVIVIGVVYLLYYLWYSLIRRSRTSPLDSCLLKLRRYSYKELNSATNGFSDDNYIGKGGSGTVYRGILRNGKLVAVKLLDSESMDADREFQNELRILGGLESQFVVSLLGYCVDKRKRLVVYEYMPNRSLQESLFSERSLNWDRRFEIILDVSRALEFLHRECDPPVIHGDVKPSNVLLDTEFRAKLSDFGLSRLKIEPEFGVDLFSQDLSGTLAGTGAGAGESPAIGTPVDNEVDFSLALQASSSSTPINSKVVCNRLKGLGFMNDKGKELSIGNNEHGSGAGNDWINNKFTNYDDDLGLTVDNNHSRESNLNPSDHCDDEHKTGKKQWGKDWWWKQDGSGELCSKDYVREWIGSQICPPANPDWDDDKNSEKPDLDHSTRLNKFKDSHDNKAFEHEEPRGWRPPCSEKRHRKMQEWWKEEHLDELSKKKVEKKIKRRFKLSIFRRKRKPTGRDLENGFDPNKEFSFRKNSKNNEMWSGDVFSRELSSTTSMRGTLCYVAPEYGGCGFLIEKADIYSFGVLILVIVSGRRPLHVLASPMKLEKANLISWCRQLAQGGDLLELVDEKLKNDYNKAQASLCVNLALACLQKMPELRPDIADIVKILKGEIDLPVLPYEFSPSPPSKLVGRSRSRRKNKNNAD
ncbi:putative receptor-like protein kinase At1g80870 [Cynara cardunculus var. scolymus]|uniref:putative receptor-like protein kinase At1g80870 n=1 Tax=Cynara cardunculus var. scolymus TaxID=59895 RepID=UPI000D62F507|nr:putative receptor-like protein kinase At1g80870 [Cynara cardunculus var. scolymus]